MTQYLYQPYVFDFDKEYEFIGIGQISSESFKEFCVANYGDEKGKDTKGWGARYKIRLCFRNDDKTPDDQLIDATVQASFPSGHAGIQISFPLAPNTFVNIHRSRFNKQYFITSVIGNTLCAFSDSKDASKLCAPRSGFEPGLGGFTVDASHISKDGKVANEAGAGAPCKISQADEDLQKLNEYINVPSACKPFDSNAINNSLKNLKKDIEGIRNKLNGPDSALTNAENFLNEQQAKITEVADKITGWVKWLINEIKLRVERGVNWITNKAKAALYLNQRFELQEKKATALDLILCLFNKILDNLSGLVEQFLKSIINRYVNMAVCAVEKFLTELVGQIIGQILSAVNGILNAALGAIAGIKGLIDSVLDAISSLLDFLSCDVKAECPDVTEWNFIEGAAPPAKILDVSGIINSAKSIISSAKSIADPNNFKFNLDINSMIVDVGDACNVGPILCGPPKISFWGGGGQGASGNAIISATGEILGIDIVSTGFGYTKPPFVTIEDACGRGSGAHAIVEIGNVPYDPGTGIGTTAPTTPGTGIGTTALKPGDPVSGVKNVIIPNPGGGYLPKPDGSMGGDGRIWADRCKSMIRRKDGTWDHPYNPGEIMELKSGDFVQFAGEISFISSQDQITTAPPCPPEDVVLPISPVIPNSGIGSTSNNYNVELRFKGFNIKNPGFGYSVTDKVVVIPDNRSELEPEFDYNGQLKKINIIKPGIGFTQVPEIGIDSDTGHNAIIIPIFDVIKGNALEVLGTSGESIINVIDCVGKPL
jgi:hypothetical protein